MLYCNKHYIGTNFEDRRKTDTTFRVHILLAGIMGSDKGSCFESIFTIHGNERMNEYSRVNQKICLLNLGYFVIPFICIYHLKGSFVPCNVDVDGEGTLFCLICCGKTTLRVCLLQKLLPLLLRLLTMVKCPGFI